MIINRIMMSLVKKLNEQSKKYIESRTFYRSRGSDKLLHWMFNPFMMFLTPAILHFTDYNGPTTAHA